MMVSGTNHGQQLLANNKREQHRVNTATRWRAGCLQRTLVEAVVLDSGCKHRPRTAAEGTQRHQGTESDPLQAAGSPRRRCL